MRGIIFTPGYDEFREAFKNYGDFLPVFCARGKQCDIAAVLKDVDEAMMKLLFVNRYALRSA